MYLLGTSFLLSGSLVSCVLVVLREVHSCPLPWIQSAENNENPYESRFIHGRE